MRELILPAANESNVLEEVPDALRADLEFHFVATTDAAFDVAFEREARDSPRSERRVSAPVCRIEVAHDLALVVQRTVFMTSSSTIDPVCGKRVPDDEGVRVTYADVELVFCSDACRREFLRHPAAYTDIPAARARDVSST